MICASTDDVVLCTTRRVSTEVAMPTASALSRDVVTPQATEMQAAISSSPAGNVNVNTTTAFQDDSLRRYELKLDDLLSVRSSIVSTGSMSDLKRDLRHTGVATSRLPASAAGAASAASSPSSTGSGVAFAPRPKTRLEDKIKMIAHYIRSLSMGLKHRHHNHTHQHQHQYATQADDSSSLGSHCRHHLHKNEKDPHQTPMMIKHRSQVSLSQYSQPRSAPDVLDAQDQKKTRANDASGNSSDMTTRCSSSSQQTSLSWDEICAGAVLVEENEVMPARPARRKRGRAAAEQYDEAELRQLCELCNVPAHNVDDLIAMVRRHFGTCQFDMTMCHELTRGNSVVLIGMLVFGCISSRDDNDEETVPLLLDLLRLPAFLRHIQSRYNDENPFHNACHAADVLHSLFMMLWTTQLGQRIAVHNQIGVLFAAIMHDVEHIGLTNDFLVQTNHEIALKYATRAPMEEMHLTLAVEMLTDPTFDVLVKMSNDQQQQVLEIVKETIRSTALCYQKELLRDVADVTKEDWTGDKTQDTGDRVLPLKTQTVALRIAMHVSDISQTMKPFAIHTKWVARLNEELFLQGDLDRRLRLGVCGDSCYRDKSTQVAFLKSQVWFLRNFALPAAQGFNSIPWLHATILEDNLHANITQWDAQLTTALLA